jgi:hypothetical protein
MANLAAALKTVFLASLLIAGAAEAQSEEPMSGSGSPVEAPAPEETAPPSADPVKPLLYGVIYGQRGWIAYIEDPTTRTVAPYRVGDTLAGKTVEAIEEERVVLKGPEGTLEILLSDEKPGAPEPPR